MIRKLSTALLALTALVMPTARADSAHVFGPSGFPLPPPWMVTEVTNRYLIPMGFAGEAVAIETPENSQIAGLYQGADIAVDTTVSWVNEHPGETLWMFGYSQSAAILSLVMPRLAAAGVPSTALHFVLVGNPAMPEGILDNLIDSFPENLRPMAESIAVQLGYGDLMGLNGQPALTTATDLYPVDVFTLTGDGYANWSWDHAMGLFFDHELYLGIDPGVWGQPVITGQMRSYTYNLAGQASWDALATLLNAAS